VPQWIERALLGLFLMLVGTSTWPLASNRPWLVALLAAALLSTLAAVLCLRATVGVSLRAQWRDASPALLPWGAWSAWVAWQAGPWGQVADPFYARIYLLKTLAYLAAFVLVVLLVRGRKRLMLLAGTLVAAGVVQALLAIVLYSSGSRYQFLGQDFVQGHRAMGTFANPDHLAHYMALCLSAGIGLMLARARRQDASARHWRARLVYVLEFVMSPSMLLRLMLVIMVIAMVLTRSRMGNGTFFVALLLLALLALIAWPRSRKGAMWLVISLVVVDVVIVGQWVGLDKVVQRIQGTELSQVSSAASNGVDDVSFREETVEERLASASYALRLVEQQPLWGHGGGSFYTVFPAEKGADRPWRFDHAHNDYVEIASDTGLPGLMLLGTLLGMTLWRLRHLLGDHQPRHRRGLAAGVAMALACMLLHSMVDFNLQITANALTLTVLLAMAWAMPLTITERPDTGARNKKL
jgi:O-antigen ligase